MRHFRNERGTALVEFALVLPFLAILVFGTIDLGRAYQLQNRLKNAAREGGRVAQYSPQAVTGTCAPGDESITNAAKGEEASASPNYTVTVTNQTKGQPIATGCVYPRSDAVAAAGDRIQVKVSSSLTIFTPFISQFIGNPVTVNGTQDVLVQG